MVYYNSYLMREKNDSAITEKSSETLMVTLLSKLITRSIFVICILCYSFHFENAHAQFANDNQLVAANQFVQDHSIDNYKTVVNNNQVFVKWTTASELEDCIYVIERSHDATEYIAVGVKEGISTSIELFYSWIDKEPLTGYAYYRIKKITQTGEQYYSAVNSVFNSSPGPEITATAQ